MISYFDVICGPSKPAAWGESEYALTEALHEVSLSFDDHTHQSGAPDYLVRFLVNVDVATHAVEEPFFTYFLVAADDAGVEVVEKVGPQGPDSVLSASFQQPWIEMIQRQFRAFRQRLGP
jgi:hypothetical protein